MTATLRFMLAQPDMPLTVENFVYFNWFGEETLADLEGEEIAEVEEFLEAVAA
ncbi:MAG: hypothetical protein WA715_19275 [Candidatus Acidiferrum sp.]